MDDFVSVELFTAGICNLNCKYCYIPKDKKMMNHFQKEILKSLENDSLLNKLKKSFSSNQLITLSHWGTEPMLTIHKFIDFYNKIFEHFVNFQNLTFSTNSMVSLNNFEYFLKNIKPKNVLNIDIQLSLDGPEWITDINRENGSTQKIQDNILNLIKLINELNNDKFTFFLRFKSTLSHNFIKELINKNKMLEYYLFFENLFENCIKENFNNKCRFSFHGSDPTIVIPYNFDSNEGKEYFQFLKVKKEIKESNNFKFASLDNSLFFRFVEFLKAENDYRKIKNVTCSAGKNMLAIGEDLKFHVCHRSYFLNYPEYSNILKNDSENKETDIKDYSRINIMDIFIENSINKLNYFQNFKLYHGINFSQSLSTLLLMINEMVKLGQINKIYKNKNLAILLALFCSVTSCQHENYLRSGSIFIGRDSLIRYFGNGAFEFLLKEFKNEIC